MNLRWLFSVCMFHRGFPTVGTLCTRCPKTFESYRLLAWDHYYGRKLDETSAYRTLLKPTPGFSCPEVIDNSTGIYFLDYVIDDCPQFVLQVLVLKAELMIPVELYGTTELLYAIRDYGIQTGVLTMKDTDWPLQYGIALVANLIDQAIQTDYGSSSAMVMNFCSSHDRNGERHALSWLFKPPFAENSAERGKTHLLMHTDLYIYLVDYPHCEWLDADTTWKLQRAARSLHLIPYKGGIKREEQTAYFKFLADHYDNLPDWTIFVHPDAPQHQQEKFRALEKALVLSHTGSMLAHRMEYYPLSWQHIDTPMRTMSQRWTNFWNTLFVEPWEKYDFPLPRCWWNFIEGYYIPYLVEGTQTGTRSEAKIACIKAGVQCVGITCLEGQCSARVGGETNIMIESYFEEEYSLVKHCPKAERPCLGSMCNRTLTAWRRAAGRHFARDKGLQGFEAKRPCLGSMCNRTLIRFHFERGGGYLQEFALGDSTQFDLGVAKSRCSEIGDACGGVTCERFDVDCTLRQGRTFVHSLTGEVSHVKSLWKLPAPTRGNGNFGAYTGSQSMIHKKRIKAVPKEMLAGLAADGDFCGEYSGEIEMIWHALFGEPVAQPVRENDYGLPFYLRSAFETKISYGDEGVE